MNARSVFALFAVLAAISVVAHADGVDSDSCSAAFKAKPVQEIVWRKDYTHANEQGEIAPTSDAREKAISDRIQLMHDEVLGDGKFKAHGGDIPPIEFLPADGVKWSYLYHTDGTSNQATRLEVSGVGEAGILKGTFLAPVSGHNGRANAIAWSTVDTYSVRWDVSSDKAGKQWDENGRWGMESPRARTLTQNAKSLGVITSQELNVPLVKDRVVRILYYRSGRQPRQGEFHDGGGGSPAGYWEGRVLEIVWDGT